MIDQAGDAVCSLSGAVRTQKFCRLSRLPHLFPKGRHCVVYSEGVVKTWFIGKAAEFKVERCDPRNETEGYHGSISSIERRCVG